MNDKQKHLRVRLGQRLAEMRRAKNVSQQEIADAVGVSQPSVSQWEKGEHAVDLYHYVLIADHLDVRVSELLSPLLSQELTIDHEAVALARQLLARLDDREGGSEA